MSAFKQKLARLGATAGVLAATTAAIMAVAGVSASSAFAAECNPKGTDIYGQGASLQKVVQEQWTGRKAATVEGTVEPHEKLAPETGFAKECPEGPTVSYNSVGSGAGLKTFRYTGTGAINTAYTFAASDDAPTAAQIKNAQAATTGANALIIPKIQTAIVMIYNPPAECSLTFDNKHGIKWAQLNEAFGGEKIKTWNGFSNASPTGAGCANEFTRVVREDGSGTTFQFKNYLSTLETKQGAPGMPCKLTGWEEPAEKEVAETTKWGDMKSNETTKAGVPNTTWPECAGTTVVKRGKGNSGVVEYVSTHPGTIAYTALPDAKSAANINGAAKVAWLQNNGPTTVTYASPELFKKVEEKEVDQEEANCGERQYEVPVGGRVGESGESVDWSKVFGAVPTIGKTFYPLCTLTYGLSWNHYEKAGYGAGVATENKVNALISYTKYVLGAGQKVKHYYQALPTSAEAKFNVLGAAELAMSKIAK